MPLEAHTRSRQKQEATNPRLVAATHSKERIMPCAHADRWALLRREAFAHLFCPPASHRRQVFSSAHAFRASLPVVGTTLIQPPPPRSVLIQTPLGGRDFTALKQACSTEYHGAQGAFKDSMIHGILQFTLPIAFRCVLHRWENQEIRCRKLCYICWPVTVQRYVSRSYKSIRVCN